MSDTVSRRTIIRGPLAAAAALAMPAILRAAPAGEVVVRGLGGAYQDAMDAVIYKPFTAVTGINVVVQLATAGQVLAMVQAGRVAIDVVDLGDLQLMSLDKLGALAPIGYDKMKLTNPGDIKASVRHANLVGNLYFATVMVYNTSVFAPAQHPQSWRAFWDVSTFPGPRTLADQRSGAAELEFALLADGAARDKLYPIDMDRAFASLDRIKEHVSKWWDTGAVSAQLLERKEAVAGAIWNGRAQALIDNGAPLAIEWNEAKQQLQAWAVLKGSPNADSAQRFIDFALQPQVQAELTRHIAYGPTNDQAFKYVRPEDLAKLPSSPENYKNSYEQNATWWSENLAEVGKRWQTWVLRKG